MIEAIFAIPGMGSHFVQAALARDYPLAMGAVLLYTLIVVGAQRRRRRGSHRPRSEGEAA